MTLAALKRHKLVVFAAVVAATRFVSLASIVAAATLPALIWMASGQPVVMGAGVAVAAFVLWSHRANLRRLRKPDPYKQKGVRYTGEVLKKKVGKTGAK